jgi:hypothetical protein
LESNGQEKILSPEEIKKLIPDYLKGFNHDADVKAKLIKVGNIQYSMCEHRFSKGQRNVRVLLFDYKEALVMYNQATKEWRNFSEILSDSLTQRSIRMTNCTGWEFYDKRSKTSQVQLGIHDRFFLELRGEEVELEIINTYLDDFKFDLFPK